MEILSSKILKTKFIPKNKRSSSLDTNYSHARAITPSSRNNLNATLIQNTVSGIANRVSRHRLLSDGFLQEKIRQKSLSRTSNLRNSKEQKIQIQENQFSMLESLRYYFKKIIENLENFQKNYKKEEKNIYLALIAAIRYKEDEDLEKRVDEEMNSKKFADFLTEFSKKLTLKIFKHYDSMLNLEKSYGIYSKITSTLYGFSLSKSIFHFLSTLFRLKGLPSKSLKFIDYFEDFKVLEKVPKKIKKQKFEEYFTQENTYETTKEDIYINTEMNDEYTYEKQTPISYTEPDCKEKLINKFYNRYRQSSPYDFEKNTFNLFQGKYK